MMVGWWHCVMKLGLGFRGYFGVSATLPSFKAQAPHTPLVHQLGAHIELTTRSLTRIFLDAENFGGDSKYIKTFMEVAEDGIIEYRHKTGTIHNHTLIFQWIPSCGDSGYIFYVCKSLVEEYVQVVIDSLHAMLLDMRILNATKNFSPFS